VLRRFDRLLLVLPGWLAFMLYLPTLSHGFVWDDTYFLTDLPLLRDPELWWQQISEPLFVSRNYFRPLPLAAFSFEARLGGLNPFVFHFVNVLLHAANTTLVVLLARALIPVGAAAAVAGLVFAIHPALVENVAWISDRFDLMMALFILLALVWEHRVSHPALRAAGIGVLFLLALLSKETAVVLLVLLPLWQAMQRLTTISWRQWPQVLGANGDHKVWAALLLALLVYLALRYAALGYFYHNDSAMARGTGLQHLLLMGKTLAWYALLAIWPFGQMLPVHPAQTPVAAGDPVAWLGLAGLFIVCASMAWLLLRRPDARRPVLAGAMALAALTPVSNLVPLTIGDNLVHDRYLMLPVAFLALALVMAWGLRRRAVLAAITAGAWIAAALVSVVGLAPYWESNLTLWTWAYTQQPESRIARENYVAALVNANRNEETVAVARKLLALGPEVPETTHNLALALARLGRYAEAERVALRAIELYPGSGPKGRLDVSEAYNLLGYIYLKQGRSDETEQALRRSIALAPYLTRPHYNLALLLFERGDLQGGDRELAFAVRYGNPELAEAHQRLGSEAKRRKQANPD
jgi:tetratricopeptide (TPR) repeat protein